MSEQQPLPPDYAIESTQSIQTPYGEQDENGTDLSLIRANLRLTPAQRLAQGDRARRQALELMEYGRRAREQSAAKNRGAADDASG
jgi:hypothetical protein